MYPRLDEKEGAYRYMTEKQYQELQRQESPTTIHLGTKNVDSAYQKAKKLIANNRFWGALPHLEEAIKLLGRPTTPSLITILFKINCLLANAYFKVGLYEKAVYLSMEVLDDMLFEGQEKEHAHYFQLYRAAAVGRAYLNYHLQDEQAYFNEYKQFIRYLETLPPAIDFFKEGLDVLRDYFGPPNIDKIIKKLYPSDYWGRLKINTDIDALYDKLRTIGRDLKKTETVLDKEGLEKKQSQPVPTLLEKISESLACCDNCIGVLKKSAPATMLLEATSQLAKLKKQYCNAKKNHPKTQNFLLLNKLYQKTLEKKPPKNAGEEIEKILKNPLPFSAGGAVKITTLLTMLNVQLPMPSIINLKKYISDCLPHMNSVQLLKVLDNLATLKFDFKQEEGPGTISSRQKRNLINHMVDLIQTEATTATMLIEYLKVLNKLQCSFQNKEHVNWDNYFKFKEIFLNKLYDFSLVEFFLVMSLYSPFATDKEAMSRYAKLKETITPLFALNILELFKENNVAPQEIIDYLFSIIDQAGLEFKKIHETALNTLYQHLPVPGHKIERPGDLVITTQLPETGLVSPCPLSSAPMASPPPLSIKSGTVPTQRRSYGAFFQSPIDSTASFYLDDKTCSPLPASFYSDRPDDVSGDLTYCALNLEFSYLNTKLEQWVNDNIFLKNPGTWDTSSFKSPFHMTILNFGAGLYEILKNQSGKLEQFMQAIGIVLTASKKMEALKIEKLTEYKSIKNYLAIEFKVNVALNTIREALKNISKEHDIVLHSDIQDYKFHITIAKSKSPFPKGQLDDLNKSFIAEFTGLEVSYEQAALVQRFGYQSDAKSVHLMTAPYDRHKKIFSPSSGRQSTMVSPPIPPTVAYAPVFMQPPVVQPQYNFEFSQSPYTLWGEHGPIMAPLLGAPDVRRYSKRPPHYR